jgi:hypothetical protein
MADPRAGQLSELIEELRVAPGAEVDLARDCDLAFKGEGCT